VAVDSIELITHNTSFVTLQWCSGTEERNHEPFADLQSARGTSRLETVERSRLESCITQVDDCTH